REWRAKPPLAVRHEMQTMGMVPNHPSATYAHVIRFRGVRKWCMPAAHDALAPIYACARLIASGGYLGHRDGHVHDCPDLQGRSCTLRHHRNQPGRQKGQSQLAVVAQYIDSP